MEPIPGDRKFDTKKEAMEFGCDRVKEFWIVHVRPLTFGASEEKVVKDSWIVVWWYQ